MLITSHNCAGAHKRGRKRDQVRAESREERSVSPGAEQLTRGSISSADRYSINASRQSAGGNVHDTNYQIKRHADGLLRQGQTNGLYELLLQQVTRCETLMADNALL